MIQPADTKLQAFLAAQLPDDVEIVTPTGMPSMPLLFWWKLPNKRQILDTEWLAVVAMVVAKLSDSEWVEYLKYWLDLLDPWQRHAIALAQVKGVEL
jgi:hypothetical protein